MKSLIIIIVLSLALAACVNEPQTAEQRTAAPAQETASTAARAAAQEQTIEVAGEFTPAAITIPANTPVRLHFRRSDKPTCADEIVLPVSTRERTRKRVEMSLRGSNSYCAGPA